MIGIFPEGMSVDGALTKSPCEGEVSGRGGQRTKRSVTVDCTGSLCCEFAVAAGVADQIGKVAVSLVPNPLVDVVTRTEPPAASAARCSDDRPIP